LGEFVLDFFGQSQLFEHPDGHIGHVDFVPTMAVFGQTLMCVVVIVPAFAVREQRDPP
jgi:hypothetical protein